MSSLELKIPPPLVALIAAGFMWLFSRELGLMVYNIPYKEIICGVLVGLGFLVDFAALWRFMQAKTTINPIKPSNASALVTTGIYQYTRNPMYVGNFIFLSAWLLWLGSPFGLVGLVMYVAYMNSFQIQAEERVLTEMFGNEYVVFCKHVRRWL